MLVRSVVCGLVLCVPLVGCGLLLGDDDDESSGAGDGRSGSSASGGGSSSGSSGQTSSSSGGVTPASNELWPLAVGASWLLTGGSGPNAETPCTESYTVTGFGVHAGRDSFAVAVTWCDQPKSTEHYAKGSAPDSLDHYVAGAWVTLYRGPVEDGGGFTVGSDNFRWLEGVAPAGTNPDAECWRLQLPLSASGFMMEFCRGLGPVRFVRDEDNNAHDVDVHYTSYTAP